MFLTRIWLKALLKSGFYLKRSKGGHARYANGTVAVDIPVHQKELSHGVVASIKRALRAVEEVRRG